MQVLKKRCQFDCFKPSGRRLGLFQADDDFECYAESYVKCFWGMCDRHKSVEDFISKPINTVILTQPLPNENILTINNPTHAKKEQNQ